MNSLYATASLAIKRAGFAVFLLDVDNTLLGNNRFATDLSTRLEQAFGAAADHLAMLQMFHVGLDDDPDLLRMSANTAIDSPPDMSIGHIGDLLNYELSHFLSSHRRAPHP